MDALFYKVVHVVSVMVVFLSLGGLISAARSGDVESRRLAGMTHGLALLVAFISGFALLGKLALGFPAWVMVKIGIWLVLGGILVAIRKQPQKTALWWTAVSLLGLVAAWLALYKPF